MGWQVIERNGEDESIARSTYTSRNIDIIKMLFVYVCVRKGFQARVTWKREETSRPY